MRLQNGLHDSCFIKIETWTHVNILKEKSEIENKRIRFSKYSFFKNKQMNLLKSYY